MLRSSILKLASILTILALLIFFIILYTILCTTWELSLLVPAGLVGAAHGVKGCLQAQDLVALELGEVVDDGLRQAPHS